MRSRGNSGNMGNCKGTRMRMGSRGNIGKEKIGVKGGGIRVKEE